MIYIPAHYSSVPGRCPRRAACWPGRVRWRPPAAPVEVEVPVSVDAALPLLLLLTVEVAEVAEAVRPVRRGRLAGLAPVPEAEDGGKIEITSLTVRASMNFPLSVYCFAPY